MDGGIRRVDAQPALPAQPVRRTGEREPDGQAFSEALDREAAGDGARDDSEPEDPSERPKLPGDRSIAPPDPDEAGSSLDVSA